MHALALRCTASVCCLPASKMPKEGKEEKKKKRNFLSQLTGVIKIQRSSCYWIGNIQYLLAMFLDLCVDGNDCGGGGGVCFCF